MTYPLPLLDGSTDCRAEVAEFEATRTAIERLPKRAGAEQLAELKTAFRRACADLQAAWLAIQSTKKGSPQ